MSHDVPVMAVLIVDRNGGIGKDNTLPWVGENIDEQNFLERQKITN